MPSTSPPVLHGKLPANGVTLHFTVSGEGPAIVLLHGWLGTSHHWRKLAPLLAPHHRVIALDARGYGDSDKPDTGYDGRTVAADVAALCQGLGVARCVIVGHDMGAPPALLLAAERPDLVAGLVYVDEPLLGYNHPFTAFVPENPFVYWWFAFNAQPHVPALMWAGKEAALVDYFMTAMAADPTANSEADKAEYVRGLRKPGGLHGAFGWYRDAHVTGAQVRAATAAKLALPVLAVNGQYGHPDVGAQMELVATDVTSLTIPNCGHLCAEEKPAEMAEALLTFAARAFAA